MADGADDKKQPWEILGFETFEAYDADRVKKIEDAEKKAEAEQAKVTLQETELAKLRKVASGSDEEGDAKKKAEAEAQAKLDAEEAERNKVDPFKEKASALYASLSPAEQAKAEQAIQKMPQEVQVLAGSGYEGKYALLKQLFPNKTEIDNGTTTGFFGDLAPEVKELTISEQIAQALSGKKVVSATPVSSGSGFVQRYESEEDSKRGRSAENPDIIANGIYK